MVGWIVVMPFFLIATEQKRLEIMKDPRMGAFGVLSVIVTPQCTISIYL